MSDKPVNYVNRNLYEGPYPLDKLGRKPKVITLNTALIDEADQADEEFEMLHIQTDTFNPLYHYPVTMDGYWTMNGDYSNDIRRYIACWYEGRNYTSPTGHTYATGWHPHNYTT